MKTIGKLELVLDKQDAYLVCDLIRSRFHLEPVVFERPNQRLVVIAVFLDSMAQACVLARKIPSDWPIRFSRPLPCREEEWTTFWRHHFHVRDIGSRFRTVPVWEKPPDRKRINLRIDPGLSFGTGDHFTTRFCLEALEQAWASFKPRSMLDAGTGSGILAIAAVKLVVKRVAAFDNDPVCIKMAKRNAVLNRIGPDRIRFYEANILERGWGQRPADLVCANILAGILMQASAPLWQASQKRLVLTGIREFEGDSVAETFVALGAREVARDGDGEWCGIVLERRTPGNKKTA